MHKIGSSADATMHMGISPASKGQSYGQPGHKQWLALQHQILTHQ